MDPEEKEYKFACGWCQRVFEDQEEFDIHRTRKHGFKKVGKDLLDEGTFGNSSEPYYIGYQLIELNHKIDTTLTDKIKYNPKVLNAKAPPVQASHWGIYDVDK